MNKGIIFISLALASVLAYLIEMSLGYTNSLESPKMFIWFERFVATVLTMEIFIRLKWFQVFRRRRIRCQAMRAMIGSRSLITARWMLESRYPIFKMERNLLQIPESLNSD